MIESGVYKGGTNPAVDRAISGRAALGSFLRQGRRDHTRPDDTVQRLRSLVDGVRINA
jgi:flagellar biosynthesis/type III secretory pathway ATPase